MEQELGEVAAVLHGMEPVESTLKGNLFYVELVETSVTEYMLAKIKKIAEARGFLCVDEYQPGLAFCLISLMHQSVAQLAQRDNVPLVNWSWLVDCAAAKKFAPPVLQEHLPFKGAGEIPGFQLFRICVTGFQIPRQNELLYYASLTGAKADTGLKARTTHLLVPDNHFNSEKVDYLRNKYLNAEPAAVVVVVKWLMDCLLAWEHVDELPYAVPPWGSMLEEPDQALMNNPPTAPTTLSGAAVIQGTEVPSDSMGVHHPPSMAQATASASLPPTLALTATQDLGVLTHAQRHMGASTDRQAGSGLVDRVTGPATRAAGGSTELQPSLLAAVLQQSETRLPPVHPGMLQRAKVVTAPADVVPHLSERTAASLPPAAAGPAVAFTSMPIKEEPISPTQPVLMGHTAAVTVGCVRGMSQLLGTGSENEASLQAASNAALQEQGLLLPADVHRQAGSSHPPDVSNNNGAMVTGGMVASVEADHLYAEELAAQQQQDTVCRQQLATAQQQQQAGLEVAMPQGAGQRHLGQQDVLVADWQHEQRLAGTDQQGYEGRPTLGQGEERQQQQGMLPNSKPDHMDVKQSQPEGMGVSNEDVVSGGAGADEWQDATSESADQQEQEQALQQVGEHVLGMEEDVDMHEWEGQGEEDLQGDEEQHEQGDVPAAALVPPATASQLPTTERASTKVAADTQTMKAAPATGKDLPSQDMMRSPFKPVADVLDAAAAAAAGPLSPACRFTAGMVGSVTHTHASPPALVHEESHDHVSAAELDAPINAAVGGTDQHSQGGDAVIPLRASGSTALSLGHASGSAPSGLGLAQGSLRAASTQDAWMNVGTLVQQLLPSPAPAAPHARSRLASFQPDTAVQPETGAVGQLAADHKQQLQQAASDVQLLQQELQQQQQQQQEGGEGPDAEGRAVVAAAKNKAGSEHLPARTKRTKHPAGVAHVALDEEGDGAHQDPNGSAGLQEVVHRPAGAATNILRGAQLSPVSRLHGQVRGGQSRTAAPGDAPEPDAPEPAQAAASIPSPQPAAAPKLEPPRDLARQPFKPPRPSVGRRGASGAQLQQQEAPAAADVINQQPVVKKRRLLAPGSSAPPQQVHASRQARAAAAGAEEEEEETETGAQEEVGKDAAVEPGVQGTVQVAKRTRARGKGHGTAKERVSHKSADQDIRGSRRSRRAQKAVLSDEETEVEEAAETPLAGVHAQRQKEGVDHHGILHQAALDQAAVAEGHAGGVKMQGRERRSSGRQAKQPVGGSEAGVGRPQRGKAAVAQKRLQQQKAERKQTAAKAVQDSSEEEVEEEGGEEDGEKEEKVEEVHEGQLTKPTSKACVSKKRGRTAMEGGPPAPVLARQAAKAAAKSGPTVVPRSPAVGAVAGLATAEKRTTRSAAKHRASRARLDSDDDSDVAAETAVLAKPHLAKGNKQEAKPVKGNRNKQEAKSVKEIKTAAQVSTPGRITRASASPAGKVATTVGRKATGFVQGTAAAGVGKPGSKGKQRVSIKQEDGQQQQQQAPPQVRGKSKSKPTSTQPAQEAAVIEQPPRGKRRRQHQDDEDEDKTGKANVKVEPDEQWDTSRQLPATGRHKKARLAAQAAASPSQAAAAAAAAGGGHKVAAAAMAFPGWAYFAMTCMPEEDRKAAEKQLRKLKANVVTGPTWQRSTTHVLVGVPLTRRSDKLICCMAAGAWLLDGSRYLADCGAAGMLLEPGPYELQQGCKFDAAAPCHWRQRSGAAFKGLRVVLLGNLPAPMDASALKLLLQAGGGECCAAVSGLADQRFLTSALMRRHPPNLAVVAPGTDKQLVDAVRQAGITCVVPNYLIEWVVRPSVVPLPRDLYCQGAPGRLSTELARLEAQRADAAGHADDEMEAGSDSL